MGTFNELGPPLSVSSSTTNFFGCIDSANERVVRRELDDADERFR